MAGLTKQQKDLLRLVGERDGITTPEVAVALDMGGLWGSGYDQANAALARLAKRGFVERKRTDNTSHWHLTAAGKDANG